jgi:AcrR family transcriptional regulator
MSRPVEPVRPRGRTLRGRSKRRDEITRLACAVIAQRGFPNTTMRDVADATGILAGSLYHHYKSKDELLAEVLRRFYADSLADIERVVEQTEDPADTIVNLIELAVRYTVERRDEATIIENDAPYLARLPDFAFVFEAAAAVEGIWLDVLERAREAGYIRPELDLPTLYRTIMGSMFALVRWYQPTGRMRPARLAKHQVMLFFDGFRPPH